MQTSSFISALVALLISLFFGGCFDPCEDKICHNGGYCIDGTCICPEGYSGNNCQLEMGYDCLNGTCYSVTRSYATPQYTTLQACQTACGPSSSGYDCISGECISTTFHPTYSSYTACYNSCGSSGGDCFSTPYYGYQACSGGSSEWVAVSPERCCRRTNPYYGVETTYCYTSCLGAKNGGNNTIVYGTGETEGGGTTYGNLLIHIGQFDSYPYAIKVTVNDTWIQYINGPPSAYDPNDFGWSCHSHNGAYFTLPEGNYNFVASTLGKTWGPLTVFVQGGKCTRKGLGS